MKATIFARACSSRNRDVPSLRGHSGTLAQLSVAPPGGSRIHALAESLRDGWYCAPLASTLTGSSLVWRHGTLKGRTSPKQPDANPRLRYSASPAPDRQAIVLALDDVVDLEHLGLTRLDPNVFQHRHEALAERFELLPRVPDLTDSELAV